MVSVEISDPGLVASFANFLAFSLPGQIEVRGSQVLIRRHGAGTPRAEQQLVERLLRAWHTERNARLGTVAYATISVIDDEVDADARARLLLADQGQVVRSV